MSVCTFGVEELANIAGVIVANRPTHFHTATLAEDIRVACEQLALVSRANVACFNDRYATQGARAVACTAEEIGGALLLLDPRPGGAEAMSTAITTARLLFYNCDDQGGDFTLKIEGAHAAIISILEGLMLSAARKAGVLT